MNVMRPAIVIYGYLVDKHTYVIYACLLQPHFRVELRRARIRNIQLPLVAALLATAGVHGTAARPSSPSPSLVFLIVSLSSLPDEDQGDGKRQLWLR